VPFLRNIHAWIWENGVYKALIVSREGICDYRLAGDESFGLSEI